MAKLSFPGAGGRQSGPGGGRPRKDEPSRQAVQTALELNKPLHEDPYGLDRRREIGVGVVVRTNPNAVPTGLMRSPLEDCLCRVLGGALTPAELEMARGVYARLARAETRAAALDGPLSTEIAAAKAGLADLIVKLGHGPRRKS